MKFSDRIERMVGPIQCLPTEIDNLIENMLGGGQPGSGQRKSSNERKTAERLVVPRTNVIEQEKAFVVSMELPGVNSSDISVEVADTQLMVSGEKKLNDLGESETWRRNERVTGRFERSFEFSTQVDLDNISAASENGILTIIVPKSEKVLPRKIDIKVK